MQLQSKHKVLLSVLAVLLLLRFIVVPIFAWQDEKIAQLQSSQQRLTKAENVIERLPQITQELEKLQRSNQQLASYYSTETSMPAFKLKQQQQIEKLFESYNVQVKNFNWAADIPGVIDQSRANITFDGKTKDFARLQLAIAQLPTLLKVTQWTAHIAKKKKRRRSKKKNQAKAPKSNSETIKSLGIARGNMIIVAYNISAEPKV